MALLSDLEFGRDVVAVLVLGDQRVDVGRIDVGHRLGQVVDAPGVDLDPEDRLGLGLVALGDRDEPHVVAEPGELERAGRRPAGRGPRPGRHLVDDARVGHVADDGLPAQRQPGLDVAELAVAVRGLVQVHEVEVDVGPRQRDVGLRVQVEQRLVEGAEPGDPHLGRAEGVHPGDDADHGVTVVRRQHDPPDLVRLGEHRLPHDPDGNGRGRLERARDLRGLPGNLLKRLRTVEVLASGQEPDLEVGERVRCGH